MKIFKKITFILILIIILSFFSKNIIICHNISGSVCDICHCFGVPVEHSNSQNYCIGIKFGCREESIPTYEGLSKHIPFNE